MSVMLEMTCRNFFIKHEILRVTCAKEYRWLAEEALSSACLSRVHPIRLDSLSLDPIHAGKEKGKMKSMS